MVSMSSSESDSMESASISMESESSAPSSDWESALSCSSWSRVFLILFVGGVVLALGFGIGVGRQIENLQDIAEVLAESLLVVNALGQLAKLGADLVLDPIPPLLHQRLAGRGRRFAGDFFADQKPDRVGELRNVLVDHLVIALLAAIGVPELADVLGNPGHVAAAERFDPAPARRCRTRPRRRGSRAPVSGRASRRDSADATPPRRPRRGARINPRG